MKNNKEVIKMMETVLLLVFCITLAILLASAISMFIMFKLMSSKKVMEAYMKWFIKTMKKYEDLDYDFDEEEEL